MGVFDVIQYFRDGSSETVRKHVSGIEAMKAAGHYCTSLGAQLGQVTRVIIIADDDTCAFEWLHGHGVTFPTPAHVREWMH